MNVTSSVPVICVDLGKTHCRVSVAVGSHVEHAAGDGLPGLASPRGVELALDRIIHLVSGLDVSLFAGAVAIGAAGAWSAPEAADALARQAAERFASGAVVTSDIVTAHVGAFAGGTGVCMIVGTGAVALGVAADGRTALRDGRGLLVGDHGSGAWLGREGLRAAEMGQASAGPVTVLSQSIPNAEHLSSALAVGQDVAAGLARYAPAVLAAAESGDGVAREIADRGIATLTQTAKAAATRLSLHTVSVLGGVGDNAWFRARLDASLITAGLQVRSPAGDAMTGALMLSTSTDLPLERSIHRARA